METAVKKSRKGGDLGRAAMRKLEKITKSKDVSLETEAKIIHSLIIPITMYGKKTARKKMFESFEIWC